MIQKTAFEILQSKLTIEDTFDFREKHLPEILEAMEEYKAQPIELPTDEEIEKQSESIAHNYFDMHNTNHYQGLKEGAERMGSWFMGRVKNKQ